MKGGAVDEPIPPIGAKSIIIDLCGDVPASLVFSHRRS